MGAALTKKTTAVEAADLLAQLDAFAEVHEALRPRIVAGGCSGALLFRMGKDNDQLNELINAVAEGPPAVLVSKLQRIRVISEVETAMDNENDKASASINPSNTAGLAPLASQHAPATKLGPDALKRQKCVVELQAVKWTHEDVHVRIQRDIAEYEAGIKKKQGDTNIVTATHDFSKWKSKTGRTKKLCEDKDITLVDLEEALQQWSVSTAAARNKVRL